MKHVAVAHFKATLLETYPFKGNGECSLCITNGARKIFSTKGKAAWLSHIVTHEEVLVTLPDTVTEVFKRLPKKARKKDVTEEDNRGGK